LIGRHSRALDEVDGAVDDVARRILVIDPFERVMAARVVQDGHGRVLVLRERHQLGHRACDRRPIETSANEQDGQLGPERLHVGRAVVHDRGLERRAPRVQHEREAARDVAGTGVHRNALAIDANRGAIGRQVRQERIEVLLDRTGTQVRHDRQHPLRCGDFGPGLEERLGTLRAGDGVEDDQRRQWARGRAWAEDVHPQLSVRLVLQHFEGRRRRHRIEEAFLRASEGRERRQRNGRSKVSSHGRIVLSPRAWIQPQVFVPPADGSKRPGVRTSCHRRG